MYQFIKVMLLNKILAALRVEFVYERNHIAVAQAGFKVRVVGRPYYKLNLISRPFLYNSCTFNVLNRFIYFGYIALLVCV